MHVANKQSTEQLANQEVVGKVEEFKEIVESLVSELHKLKKEVKEKGFFSLWMDSEGLFNKSSVADINSEIKEYEDFYERIKKTQVKGSYEENKALLVGLQKELRNMRSKSENLNSKSRAIKQLRENFAKSDSKELEIQIQGASLVAAEGKILELEEKLDEILELNRDLANKMKKSEEVGIVLAAKVERLEKQNENLATSLEELSELNEELRDELRKSNQNCDALIKIVVSKCPEVAEALQGIQGTSVHQQADNQQQQSSTQASCSQSSQQQETNAQAANDQQGIQASGAGFDQQQNRAANDPNVQPMSRSRSSSLSSSGSSNNDQSGPSSRLSGVQLISRSQSLNSLCSNDSGSDIEVVNKSQCR